MKRIVTTVALLVAFASTASAVTLVSEGFNYPNGNLVPNGGWANYSGANVDIQVASGRATGGALPNNQNDDHILFPAQSTSTKTYACFDVIIPPVVGAPKAIYFFSLKDAGAANLVSRLYVLPVAGGFTFGISHSSTSTTVGVTAFSSSSLVYGQKYNVVLNYNPVAKTSTLWVNPSSELSPSVTDANAAIVALAVSGAGLRQSNSASALPAAQGFTGTVDWNWSVDNLGVGNTFNEACVQYQATPVKRSTWGAVKSIYR